MGIAGRKNYRGGIRKSRVIWMFVIFIAVMVSSVFIYVKMYQLFTPNMYSLLHINYILNVSVNFKKFSIQVLQHVMKDVNFHVHCLNSYFPWACILSSTHTTS